MSDVLPKGWEHAEICAVCTLENGRAFKPSEWTPSGLPIVRIQNLNNQKATFNCYSGATQEKYSLKGGELLFAWSGTPGTSFGAHIWRGKNAVLNQHIFRVDFNDSAIEKRFFRYAINQKLGELIDVAHGGVGLRHVTKGVFEKTLVSVPPLPEQKRIADKLDALLARVDACRERLDRVPKILKRFRQSVLAAATSGELTREWGTSAGDGTEWDQAVLGDLVQDGPKNGLYKQASSYGSGTRILRIDNFYDGFVRPWEELKRLEVTAKERLDYGLAVGDIVINRVNSLPYLGKAALIRDLPQECVFESNMMRIRLEAARVRSDYAILFLTSPAGIAQLRSNAKHAVNQASINQTDVGNVSVPLPSLPEQAEIVRQVESLFAMADAIAACHENASFSVNRLAPSSLAKAFCGELVPQDPNDEPASELLARIRTQEAVTASAKPKRGNA